MESLLAWGHFLAGITWIGILYYFQLSSKSHSLKVSHTGNES